MITLAFDTCLTACTAAVLEDERVLVSRVEPMARGHQERLAPLVYEVMAEAELSFDRLDRIGVTIGPGSFTGLRVGLAFAKGLGAALDRPVIGIGVLEALAEPFEGPSVVFSVLDAKRGQVYLQAFAGGKPLMAYQIAAMQAKGQIPNKEASVSKNFGSELGQRIGITRMKMLGMLGQLRNDSKYQILDAATAYTSGVAGTIAGGTSEINRNVIATRGLGLPRG